MLEVDISGQQTFTYSPQTVDSEYHNSYVDNNCSPMKSITMLNVVDMKLTGTIVVCSIPEANAKALPENSKSIFPLTINSDLENKNEKRFNFLNLKILIL